MQGCWGCQTSESGKDKRYEEREEERQEDIKCIRYLNMNRLENKELPQPHAYMLYRYMDISNCQLSSSICNPLDTRNAHWINNDQFDPTVHEFHCGPGCKVPPEMVERPGERKWERFGRKKQEVTEPRENSPPPRLALTEHQTRQLRQQYAPSPFYVQECSELDAAHSSYCKHHERCEHMERQIEHMWEGISLNVRQTKQREGIQRPFALQGGGRVEPTDGQPTKNEWDRGPDFYAPP